MADPVDKIQTMHARTIFIRSISSKLFIMKAIRDYCVKPKITTLSTLKQAKHKSNRDKILMLESQVNI